jgi:hypothetical protein
MEVGIVLIPLAHRAKEDKDAKKSEKRGWIKTGNFIFALSFLASWR